MMKMNQIKKEKIIKMDKIKKILIDDLKNEIPDYFGDHFFDDWSNEKLATYLCALRDIFESE